jgi:hypothetical protein
MRSAALDFSGIPSLVQNRESERMKVCILGHTQNKFSPNLQELLAEIPYEYVKERLAVLLQTDKGHLLSSEARVHLRVASCEIDGGRIGSGAGLPPFKRKIFRRVARKD